MCHKDVKEVLKNLIKTGEITGVALVVIKNGKIILNEVEGISSIGKKMERENKFRIASISKLVTTIGFMKLVESGKISLEDDISDYLDFDLRNLKYPNIKITPRMLLSHTSSIRDSDYYTAPMSFTLKDFFCKGGKYYEDGKHFGREGEKPGEYFNYSNLNFGIIATLIERLTNTRFDIYMKKEIFEKLGIEASFNVKDFGEDIDKIGVLYRKDNRNWIPQVDDYRGIIPERSWYTKAIGDYLKEEREKNESKEKENIEKYIIGSNGTLFSPQGGLRISAEDLSKIMMMLLNRGLIDGKKIIGEKTIKEMEDSYWNYNETNGDNVEGFMNNYGLGTNTLRKKDFKEDEFNYLEGYKGHTGQAYGLLSALYYKPGEATGYIYYITGTERPSDEVRGKVSPFTRWEEEILSAIKGFIS